MATPTSDRSGGTPATGPDAPLDARAGALEVIIEHLRDAVLLVDARGVVTFASRAVSPVLGYDPDELVGTAALEFLHPDDVGDAMAQAAKAYASDVGIEPVTVRLRLPDKSWRPIEVSAVLIEDDEDLLVLSLRDVRWRTEAEEALRRSEDRFRVLLEHSSDAVVVTDPDRVVLYASPAVEHAFGFLPDEVTGTRAGQAVHPDDRERLREATREVYRTPGATTALEARVGRSDGGWRWVELSYTNLTHVEHAGGIVIHVNDITERRSAERDNKRLIDVFDNANELIGMCLPDGEYLYLNAAARQFIGLPTEGPAGTFDTDTMFPTEVAEAVDQDVRPRLLEDGRWNGELIMRRHDGAEVPMLAQFTVHRDPDDGTEYLSGVLHDISERKEFESALAHQATHDPLTGLPNRSLILDRLEVALRRAERHGHRIAVLFLDLDHFKVVNDSLGHDLGDQLLVSIADRLKLALRPGDSIARFGGDEFVVLCEDLHRRDDAAAIAGRLIDAVSGPFRVADAEVFVGMSIGIAFPDSRDDDPGTLIRDADAAMYQAKARGRARWEVFDNELRAIAVERLDIENALRKALERRELRVFFQPIVRLADGGIDGVEALVRWEHPQRGLLLPGEFITVAEETGLIVPIGNFVLDQAARQVQRWHAAHPGLGTLNLSVNLSGRQVGHPALADDVRRVLEATHIDPSAFELEITESVLMDDVEMSEETLGRLHQLGVRLAVDDFGTGYSSLSYLRRFPVDVLKVDRSFVDGLGTDPSDSAIVAAIVTLAHTLGLGAVAEGVETAGQLAELRRLGCDKAQGFYMARPGNAHDIGALLASGPQW